MRVGIYFGAIDPHIGGGSTLLRTIQNSLSEFNLIDIEYVCIYSGGQRASYCSIVNGLEFYNIDRVLGIRQKIFRKICESFALRRASRYYRFDILAEKYDIDIFWFTSPINADISYPFIFTVWDLGYRTVPYFPEVSREWEWEARELMYRKMLPKSSYIITGNKEGEKEILTNFKINPNKIRISPFPISNFCYRNEKKPKFVLSDCYFFYPAQFWSHKNHITIIEAVDLLKKNFSIDVKVYFTGADKGNRKYIQEEIERRDLQDSIIITGFLEEEELKYLYTHARAMIFASLMGPNNLPPIEATYLGCPVIITDLDGHKEQLEDSALYFEGTNAYDLAYCIKDILIDDNKYEMLKEKQKTLKEKFTKVNYIRIVLDILNEFKMVKKCWR